MVISAIFRNCSCEKVKCLSIQAKVTTKYITGKREKTAENGNKMKVMSYDKERDKQQYLHKIRNEEKAAENGL